MAAASCLAGLPGRALTCTSTPLWSVTSASSERSQRSEASGYEFACRCLVDRLFITLRNPGYEYPELPVY